MSARSGVIKVIASFYRVSLLVGLPDVVYLGKSLKCSWANWFIDLESAKSNLVLIRTLRDCGGPDIRKELRILLTLECVRNKDRTIGSTAIRRETQ